MAERAFSLHSPSSAVAAVYVILMFCCEYVANAILREGDLVTFGHMQGEHLPPGTWQRQPDSDFQYIVSISDITFVQFVLQGCSLKSISGGYLIFSQTEPKYREH